MSTKRRKAQVEKVLDFLSAGKKLTKAEAQRRFGVRRLSARIYDLRENGFEIETKFKSDQNKVPGYVLLA